MKRLTYILTLVVISTLLSGCATSKSSSTKTSLSLEQVNTLIEQKDIYFEANLMTPMQGRSRNLTYGYYAKISGDTLDVHLPYFGRAYSTPIDPTNMGIKLISTDFEYKVEQRKNKSFDVTIKPNKSSNPDLNGIVLYFNLFEGGSASLNISAPNRQPISFGGEFEANKKP